MYVCMCVCVLNYDISRIAWPVLSTRYFVYHFVADFIKHARHQFVDNETHTVKSRKCEHVGVKAKVFASGSVHISELFS